MYFQTTTVFEEAEEQSSLPQVCTIDVLPLPSEELAAQITKVSSKQTYCTIGFLADRERVADAYRAYAYFRWLDDCLDGQGLKPNERTRFLERQQALVKLAYRGEWPSDLSAEEKMLFELVQNNPQKGSDLQSYIQNMMAVMVFDTYRRGRLISAQELRQYSWNLAAGVTDALHYFIGKNEPAPHSHERYLAVNAAHITHMLRDSYEDMEAGYYNIASEFLSMHRMKLGDLESECFRLWVQKRVALAREYFETGRPYVQATSNLRRRLAGYAYTARFEWLLDTIEREDFRIRPAYPERKSFRAGMKMVWSMLLDWLPFELGVFGKRRDGKGKVEQV